MSISIIPRPEETDKQIVQLAEVLVTELLRLPNVKDPENIEEFSALIK
jgi:hypothetical protein